MTATETEGTFHSGSFEDAFQKVKIQVTTDLVTCATMLRRLLMAVDLFPLGGLYRGHYAEQAIRRYWLMWMPLLHEQQQSSVSVSKLLIPPLDVQWAWFVHRLNPTKYLADCTARFGAGVHPANVNQALGFSSFSSSSSKRSHQPQQRHPTPPPHLAQGQRPQSQLGSNPISVLSCGLTCQLWRAKYETGPGEPLEHTFWPPAPAPCPKLQQQQQQQQLSSCPKSHLCRRPYLCRQFQLQQQQPQSQGMGTDVVAEGRAGDGGNGGDGDGGGSGDAAAGSLASVRSYVVDAMIRQGKFLHQVLRYFYQDPDFLEAGRIRYLRFLALARTQAPGAPSLNPMYDQDLMWHSHMALSAAYVADCEVLMPAGRRPMGHDDTLSVASLEDSFAFTRTRYESLTGLMVNPSPTRRVPATVAQPLVSQLWPLAAALADPRVTELPPPRKLAAELRAGGMQQQRHHHHHHFHHNEHYGQKGRGLSKDKGKGESLITVFGGSSGSRSSRTSGSRSGVFAGGPSTAQGPRSGVPPMLGSPDHLCRSGAFAMFALWSLGNRLQLKGPGEEDGAAVAAAVKEGEADDGGGGGGRRLLGACFFRDAAASAFPASSSGFGVKSSSVSFLTAARAAATGGGGGGGRIPSIGEKKAVLCEGELVAAIRFMAQQLLKLTDLADPSSPLASNCHPFYDHLAPLPPPLPSPSPHHRHPQQQQQQQDQQRQQQQQQPPPPPPPAASAAACTPPAVESSRANEQCATEGVRDRGCCTTGDSTTGDSCRSRRRHPSPAPRIDLPYSDLTSVQRAAEPVYLASHQYAVWGQVFYTPSDYCLLGDGRWCLPAPLATEIAEQEAVEAGAVGCDVQSDDDTVARHLHARRHRRRSRHGAWWRPWRRRRHLYDDGEDINGDDRALRLYGNTLGGIVFSPCWPSRMAECYRLIYKELRRHTAGRNRTT